MKKQVSIHDIEGVRYIVVGNEAFDWGVEESHFLRAKSTCNNDPTLKANFLGSIEKHFVSCFSQFIGRKVKMEEINESIERGWIDV
jgi:hypothetical protein